MSRCLLLLVFYLMCCALPASSQSYIPPENRPTINGTRSSFLAADLIPPVMGEGFNLNYTFLLNSRFAVSMYQTFGGVENVNKPVTSETEVAWELSLSGEALNVYYLHLGLYTCTRTTIVEEPDPYGLSSEQYTRRNDAQGITVLAGKRWISGMFGVTVVGGFRVVIGHQDYEFTESSILHSTSSVQFTFRISSGIAF